MGTSIRIRFRNPGSTHVNPRSRVTSPRVNVIGAPTGKLADKAESSRASETFFRATYPVDFSFTRHSLADLSSFASLPFATRVSMKSGKHYRPNLFRSVALSSRATIVHKIAISSTQRHTVRPFIRLQMSVFLYVHSRAKIWPAMLEFKGKITFLTE